MASAVAIFFFASSEFFGDSSFLALVQITLLPFEGVPFTEVGTYPNLGELQVFNHHSTMVPRLLLATKKDTLGGWVVLNLDESGTFQHISTLHHPQLCGGFLSHRGTPSCHRFHWDLDFP